MQIFKFLSKNKTQDQAHLDNYSPTNIESNYTQVIPEETFIEREQLSTTADKSEEIPQIVITNNLDHLYRFLDKNMESQGYDDALTNPDSYHLEQNLDALRKELMRTIKRVKTFYEDFIREIDYHVDSRSRSGMIDTVEELKMKKEIAQSHIEKVLLIETDALNKEGDSEGIIISYTRGFRNGLAAISHHTIISKKF